MSRSFENQFPARWLLALIPLLATTNATLTIALPAAHRTPLGLVLLTISATCWLTVLLFARRLHHTPTPSTLSVHPQPTLPPLIDDQPSPILHAAVILARHGHSPQYIADRLHLPLAFAELLAHHATEKHNGDANRPNR